MATIKRGILGGFKGKVANVIGSSWKGIATMRSQPLSVANPKSAGQVEQRSKFSFSVMIASFLLSIIIKPFWDRFSVQMSGYNSFIQTNSGKFVDWATSQWDQVLFSVGKIGFATDYTATFEINDGTLSLAWTNNSGSENRLSTDKVYFVLIDKVGQQMVGGDTQSTRNDEAASVSTDLTVANVNSLACYILFMRADGSMVSTSQYSVVVAS